MRTPSLLIAVTLASLLGACTDPEPQAANEVERDLDLALAEGDRGGVATALEVKRVEQPKTREAAAPRRSHTAEVMAHLQHEPAAEVVMAPVPAPANARPAEEPVALPAATESETPALTTAKGASDPEPQTARGPRGGWYPVPTDIGVERAGREPAIIIRGGGHGDDVCDEREVIGGVGRLGGIAARTGIGGRTGGEGTMNPRGPTIRGPVGRTY